jgi:hypothetical protein
VIDAAPRRAILEVQGGRPLRRKLVVDPGQTVRVGRSNVVDLSFPQDAGMSAVHFSLSWDGQHARIRDLESAAGTWVGGKRIQEVDAPSGSFVRAGSTYLMLYLEANTPAQEGAPSPIEQVLVARHALAHVPRLHAIVDAARGPRPLQLLREAVDPYESLYEGSKGDALAEVAPHLVAFRADSGLLDRLVREGWGARWGVFLSCARPFTELRRHLRRFLLVEDDATGERLYLRFYDPHTLRMLVPTCTPRQRADLFGDIDAFFAEGPSGEVVAFPRQVAT